MLLHMKGSLKSFSAYEKWAEYCKCNTTMIDQAWPFSSLIHFTPTSYRDLDAGKHKPSPLVLGPCCREEHECMHSKLT